MSLADGGFPNDVDFPAEGGTIAQSYVMTLHNTGTSSGGLAAIELAHVCDNLATSLPIVGGRIFADGFESGNVTQWSSSVP